MSYQHVDRVLEFSKSKGSDRLVLIAIAWYANDADGLAWPAIETIAERAGVSAATVYRCLDKLADELHELQVHKNEGPRGTHVYRMTVADGEQMELLATSQSASTSQSATPLADCEDLSDCNPNLVPSTSYEGEVPGSSLNLQPPLRLQAIQSARREQKRMLAEAEKLWRAGRRRARTSRYSEPSAIRALKTALGRAFNATRCTWPDIEKALGRRAADPASPSPWYADEWIAEAVAERVQRETAERALRKRIEENADKDRKAEAQWTALEAKHPGKSRTEIFEIERRQREAS